MSINAKQKASGLKARLATMNELRETILPAYLAPVPSVDTLRDWFDTAKVSRFKINPSAKRGGGQVYYSVVGVERLLKNKTLCRCDG